MQNLKKYAKYMQEIKLAIQIVKLIRNKQSFSRTLVLNVQQKQNLSEFCGLFNQNI